MTYLRVRVRVCVSSTLLLQAAARAAHLAAASAPLVACAKGRRATPAAVSEEPAAAPTSS